MPYVWRQGFEPSDLVGAPVQTKYGPGIVRSVVVESNDLEERIDQAAAAAAFTIAVDLLRADNQADASSSRDNADGTGASPTAEELRSTSPVTTTSPSTAAASAVAAVDQNSITTSSATVTVRVKSADEQTYPACSPGTCLLTTFGTGVLVSYRPSDGVHVVRLWRPRGAGSALGYLRRSALLRPLPAAVGIRVQTPDGDGVVVGFESGDGDDTFAVEVTTGSGGDTQTRVVHVGGDVVLSPVSKVMPLVERVADRSVTLVSAQTKKRLGAGARDLLAAIEGTAQGCDGKAKGALVAAGDALPDDDNTCMEGVPNSGRGVTVEADSILAGTQNGWVDGVANSGVRRAAHLLTEQSRAEADKIESLVLTGGKRLEELIARGSESGDLVRLWEEGKEKLMGLVGKGSQVLDLERHLSSLRSLAEDSPELAKIVADLEAGVARARELQVQLEATKSVGVLMEGKTRLEAGLGEVMNSYRDDETVTFVRARGERLLKALTEEDSPAVTKGMKLLRGAQERALAQGEGWTTRVLAGAQSIGLESRGGLSEALLTAAASGGFNGAAVQEVVRLLRGDAASRVSDDALRLLECVTLAYIEAVPPPKWIMTNLPAVLDSTDVGKQDRATGEGAGGADVVPDEAESGGVGYARIWCAQDLVDQFESGQLADEVLRGVAKQASSQALTILQRMSDNKLAEGSAGMEALKKLLQKYERGEAGLEEATTCALDFLNSADGQSLAGALVSRGEWGLESLKALPRDGAVGKVLERLADPELEARIMRGIESIDTDKLLDTAERAVADAEARARLLEGIKDSTVDFLLEYLPHIEIPPISGTSSRVGYAITNLNLSGFRLRKEDVEVELVDLSNGLEGSAEKQQKSIAPGFNGNASRVSTAAIGKSVDDGAVSSRKDVNSEDKNATGGGTAAGDSLEISEEISVERYEEEISLPIPPSGSPAMIGLTWDHSSGSTVARMVVVPSGTEKKNPDNNHEAYKNIVRDLVPPPWATVTHGDGSIAAPPPPPFQESSARIPEKSMSAAGPGICPPGEEVAERYLGGVGEDTAGVGGEGRHTLPSSSLKFGGVERKPAEILRVMVKGVRAEFKTLQWACRQESFPYTRGTGTADATVVDGHVQLGFSIKRGVVDPEKGLETPLLVLSTRVVSLDRLDLTVANCRMAWLINLLTRLFSSTISTYLCRALQAELDGHAAGLLGTINGFAEGSWPFLLSLTSVTLDDLPLASPEEVAMARGEGVSDGGLSEVFAGLTGLSRGGGEGTADVKHRPLEEVFVREGEAGGMGGSGVLKLKGFVQEDFGVVFDEEGPLGMQIDVDKGRPRRVIVSGLHAGGQAERICSPADGGATQAYSLVGSELLSVGGKCVQDMEGRKVLGLLRSSPCPVQMIFRAFVPDVAEAIAAAAIGDTPNGDWTVPERLVTATFTEKSLGVKFRASPSLGTRVTVVGGFSRTPEGHMRAAEASGVMRPGQLLYSVNGKCVLGRDFAQLVHSLQRVGRPVEFGLVPPLDVRVNVEGPPLELELRRVSGRVTVTGFCEVPTALEASGAIRPGDVIVSVNGIPLPGAGCYKRDAALLEAPGMFPMRIKIKRPSPPSSDAGGGDPGDWGEGWGDVGMGTGGSGGLESSLSRLKQYQGGSSSSTEALAACPEDLSLTVEEGEDGRPRVVSMPYVKGKLEKEGVVQPGMVLVEIRDVPMPGGHFGSVSDCRRTLDSTTYPTTLTFRDMSKYVWLSRVLASGTAKQSGVMNPPTPA